jgi:hypothetical protein
MVYYHIQSWQNYYNGATEGEDVLKEEEGSLLPAYNQSPADYTVLSLCVA